MIKPSSTSFHLILVHFSSQTQTHILWHDTFSLQSSKMFQLLSLSSITHTEQNGRCMDSLLGISTSFKVLSAPESWL